MNPQSSFSKYLILLPIGLLVGLMTFMQPSGCNAAAPADHSVLEASLFVEAKDADHCTLEEASLPLQFESLHIDLDARDERADMPRHFSFMDVRAPRLLSQGPKLKVGQASTVQTTHPQFAVSLASTATEPSLRVEPTNLRTVVLLI